MQYADADPDERESLINKHLAENLRVTENLDMSVNKGCMIWFVFILNVPGMLIGYAMGY